MHSVSKSMNMAMGRSTILGILLLLVLAGTVSSQDIGPAGTCCMQDTFEGLLGETTVNTEQNDTETITTSLLFSYDYPNRRIVVQGYLGDTAANKAIVYFLESPPRAYMVIQGNPEGCFIQTLNNLDLFPPCEPAGSIRAVGFYFGATSEDSMPAFFYMQTVASTTAFYTVSDDCSWYMRAELRQSPAGVTIGNTINSYMNMTAGIKDEAVFIPPEDCSQPSADTDIDTSRLESIMRAIFVFPATQG